jgi:hypothetical protein
MPKRANMRRPGFRRKLRLIFTGHRSLRAVLGPPPIPLTTGNPRVYAPLT